MKAVPLHGNMPQAKRIGALNQFQTKDRNILIATDVASRFVVETMSLVESLTCMYLSPAQRVGFTISGSCH